MAQDVNSGLVSWILAAQRAWSVSSSTDVAEAVSRYLCEGDYCALNHVFCMLSLLFIKNLSDAVL